MCGYVNALLSFSGIANNQLIMRHKKMTTVKTIDICLRKADGRSEDQKLWEGIRTSR